mmetsp:Transcript_43831/g.129764  ORF Transcript_43831/g.129764 Transcript_43831/m.129764 type:complete len:318 (-) Transcript_43831:840-1793(-)
MEAEDVHIGERPGGRAVGQVRALQQDRVGSVDLVLEEHLAVYGSHASLHDHHLLLERDHLPRPEEHRLEDSHHLEDRVGLQVRDPPDLVHQDLVDRAVVSHLPLQALGDLEREQHLLVFQVPDVLRLDHVPPQLDPQTSRQAPALHQGVDRVRVPLELLALRVYGAQEHHDLRDDVGPHEARDEHEHGADDILQLVLRRDIAVPDSRERHHGPVEGDHVHAHRVAPRVGVARVALRGVHREEPGGLELRRPGDHRVGHLALDANPDAGCDVAGHRRDHEELHALRHVVAEAEHDAGGLDGLVKVGDTLGHAEQPRQD